MPNGSKFIVDADVAPYVRNIGKAADAEKKLTDEIRRTAAAAKDAEQEIYEFATAAQQSRRLERSPGIRAGDVARRSRQDFELAPVGARTVAGPIVINRATEGYALAGAVPAFNYVGVTAARKEAMAVAA